MYLQAISLNNFKNYEQQHFVFSPNINMITGRNGAGKTNLLDAVHYLCFCKSYFHNAKSQNIRHEQNYFRLEGRFMLNGVQENLLVKVAYNRNQSFSRNKVAYTKLSEHIGLFPLVMIAPDDVYLIKGASENRRKLLNTTISQINKKYLKALILYNKILTQRNALLKRFHEQKHVDLTLLETYDEQLIPSGEVIHSERKQFITYLLPILQKYYECISGGKEQICCVYKTSLERTNLRQILKNNHEQDCHLQRTTTGIHRDDLVFEINTHPLKKFGSQGQQKSFLIALKLAIYQILYDHNPNQTQPILLLDDIFDKLDEQRIQQLVQIVTQAPFGQVFISDTQLVRMQQIFRTFNLDAKIFHLKMGKVVDVLN